MSRICGLEGCKRTHHAHGWCRLHYRRWKRTGEVGPVEKMGKMDEATSSPSTHGLHWAAGFIEGEGSFTCRRVQVGQKDRTLLDRLKRMFGGSIYAYENTDRVAQWCVSGPRARGVAMTLYPLLSERRQQAIRENILS